MKFCVYVLAKSDQIWSNHVKQSCGPADSIMLFWSGNQWSIVVPIECSRGWRKRWKQVVKQVESGRRHRCSPKKIIIKPRESTGWWFGCHQFYFPINIGLLIIPIDSHIFQRGGPTTNQLCFDNARHRDLTNKTLHFWRVQNAGRTGRLPGLS